MEELKESESEQPNDFPKTSLVLTYHCRMSMDSYGMLTDRVALVTGGTRGIGLGIVEKLASEGAKVAFTYVSSDEKARAMEADFAAKGLTVKGYKSDASNAEAAEKLIAEVLADLGALDILVNNAGITKDGLLLRMSEEAWDSVMDVNLKSVFLLTKAALKSLMKNPNGASIINMSSVVGRTGNSGQANYAASKAGIIGFTQSVAKELGSRNVRANVIAPGFIETEMTDALPEETRKAWTDKIPLKRGGTPEDVANAVLFLASPLSAYITGQVINVCGGMEISG
jgi:3-oxoacyl-[acyl-carrier protein] reductase